MLVSIIVTELNEQAKVTPYQTGAGKRAEVEEMFDNIAHRYDFLNNLFSLKIHKLWRRKVVRMLAPHKPAHVLDIATGTAEFALETHKLLGCKVTGIDISARMLLFGKKKVNAKGWQSHIELHQADSEHIPYPDNSFDAATVGFGVRNFDNLENGLSEILRVLKAGGVLYVLEFSKPKRFPVKHLFNYYFRRLLPAAGRWLSKDSRAYSYLPESVQSFPDGERFLSILIKTGYKKPACRELTFGIASIYSGVKP